MDAEDPLFILYTSGSTGTPKGVVLPHRALGNLIEWQVGEPGFEGPVRTLQFTALSFDVHFQEIFATWAAGGELVFVDDGVRRDPTRLLALMDQAGVERIFLPFVALQQLAEVATTHGPVPASLREVVTAGEQLHVNGILRAFFERLPGCRLHNHYGPSETHVVTAHTLSGPPASWPVLPPIGRPIAGTTIHLLDGDGAPVPGGEAGELCVSGRPLADGYWRSPERTEERFVQGPGGTRIYRTGDLARVGPEGDIEFLGRLDHQVKIRGHRVEPGEVEAEILRHPAVRECAVAARDDGQGGRRLTAYLILDSSRSDLRARAQALRTEKLSQWQGIWDGTYADGSDGHDPALDLRGWVDSTHGHPIPEADMRVWADGSADQVRALEPESVLEIGAGTGLMLFRIAPGRTLYHATDFSPAAVDLLRRRAHAAGLGSRLRFDVASADEIDRFPDRYDVVLLNSVTQHFPSVDYLLDVLRAAARRARGGHIFVGDVTSAVTRKAFLASVEGARARSGEPLRALRDRVARRLGQEEELVVDPRLFTRLAEWVPGVDRVEVRLKPGRYRNELSRYRYDVLIGLEGGGPDTEPLPVRGIPWDPALVVEGGLRRLLAAEPDQAVRVVGIPNARTVDAVAAARTLEAGEGETVGDWRAASQARGEGLRAGALEPQDLVELGREVGRPVQVTWGEGPDTFDAVFRPSGRPEARLDEPAPRDTRDPGRLASQPLNTALMPQVETELRRALADRLPEYMVPDRFELLAEFPRTPSGKLDRRALPEPGRQRPALSHDYVPPRGGTEEALAGLWSEVLQIDGVGVTDSFFDLGGNSILTVRFAALLKERLARKLPLVSLFQYPTIRGLAALLDGSGADSDAADDRLDERAQKQRRALAARRRSRRE
jgi:amino acid adenylation domain-containing protein